MLAYFHIEGLVLHIINTLVLFAILLFLVYKPLRKFMRAREERIAASLDRAEQARQEAEQLRASREQDVATAEEEARARALEITDAAGAAALAMAEEAKREADALLSQARASARAEHDSAMEGLRGEVVDLAAEMAARILREQEVIPIE